MTTLEIITIIFGLMETCIGAGLIKYWYDNKKQKRETEIKLEQLRLKTEEWKEASKTSMEVLCIKLDFMKDLHELRLIMGDNNKLTNMVNDLEKKYQERIDLLKKKKGK